MLTICGDIHGQVDKFIKLTEKEKYIVQIGDFGFQQAFNILKWLSPSDYKVFFGNHDAYNRFDEFLQSGHNLGHFGRTSFGEVDFFFIRGGCSIDFFQRTEGFDYFLEEELSIKQGMDCIKLYEKEKPEIVLSHEAPKDVTNKLFPDRSLIKDFGYSEDWSSKTQNLLQECLDCHRPKVWIFGHHHKFRDEVIDGTRFICLPELGMCRIHSVDKLEFLNFRRTGGES